MTRGALAVAAFAAMSMAACGSPKREECRSLSTLINAGAERIEKAQASPLDPTGLKALAGVLEKSATDAEALPLKAPDLQKNAKDYAALVRGVAKTSRDMAAAGEAGDLEKAKAANLEMEKLVGDEPKIVAELNKLCAAE